MVPNTQHCAIVLAANPHSQSKSAYVWELYMGFHTGADPKHILLVSGKSSSEEALKQSVDVLCHHDAFQGSPQDLCTRLQEKGYAVMEGNTRDYLLQNHIKALIFPPHID